LCCPALPSQNTGFRNLDDYVDKCSAGIDRRKQRLEATTRDQRALLDRDGGDPAQPSFWVRLQAGCLRCLASLTEISEIVGKMRKDIVPVVPAPAGVHYPVPQH
jgi:hypothetical protein